MTSILTNNGAMSALQTLKNINRNMGEVQSQISTGLKIANAKDNASIWAITQTMRSDVSNYAQVKDGLNTALSAVNVGRDATESINELLQEMKDKVVASSAPGADVGKIQTDVDLLREQITSVVDAASFNGLNFVNSAAGANILTSVDRDATGNVTPRRIAVSGVDLSVAPGVARGALTGSAGAVGNNDLAAFTMAAGAAGAAGSTLTIDDTNLAAGDKFEITVGGKTAAYTVTADDVASTTTGAAVAVKLKGAIENLGVAGVTVDYNSASPNNLVLANGAAGNVDRDVTARLTSAGAGGLSALSTISLATQGDRDAALATVETSMQTAIDAAAGLGSAQNRLEIQQEFIGKLSDNVKSGIGAMVDADMEEASARLQALQVQQQLGTQSLSIANQAPQSVLSLFR